MKLSGLFRATAPNLKSLVLINLDPFAHHPRASFSTAAAATEQRAQREAVLKTYGLSHLQIEWPRSSQALKQDDVNYMHINPSTMKHMYGACDLARVPIFQGGFINFGYWSNPFEKKDTISTEERIASSKALYQLIVELAGIVPGAQILDVGSGQGFGAHYIAQHYRPGLVIGLDACIEQIQRAQIHHAVGIDNGQLRFALGSSEMMPFASHSFDTVISVEAAQHFQSIPSFAQEVARILKPGGSFAMTSFFPETQEAVEVLHALIPDYPIHGSAYTTTKVHAALAKHLSHVHMTSIGKNVWSGFNRWLKQIGYQNQWSMLWEALYQRSLIDYVVVQGKKDNNMSLTRSVQMPR